MDSKVDKLTKKFKELKESAVNKGCKEEDVVRFLLKEAGKFEESQKASSRTPKSRFKLIFFMLLLPTFLATVSYYYLSDSFDETSPCTIDNNVFVMEASRAIVDCKAMCKDLTGVPKVSGLTANEFVERYAYSSRPLVVTDATKSWSAVKTFSYEFFRRLYTNTPNALNTTDEECQFFPYKTEFHSLREVFKMSKARSQFKPKAKPWYIGWYVFSYLAFVGAVSIMFLFLTHRTEYLL